MNSIKRELKRLKYAFQIATDTFRSPELEFRALEMIIEPGMVCLDVGANVGHYTMAMARLAGMNGRVIAFEPIPETAYLLSANAMLSPYQNISIVNMAASNNNCITTMSIPNGNYYRARIDTMFDMIGIPVNVITIDSLGLNKCDFLKIDAEGSDDAVIDGAMETIQRCRPFILGELLSGRTENRLQDLGYTFRSLVVRDGNFEWSKERTCKINQFYFPH